MKKFTRYFLLIALALLTLTVHAEQKKRFANYDVHYSVVNSTFITPKVAAAYNITRGNNRAFVNISVREISADGSNKEKRAVVTGKSSDLIRSASLDFNEIIEKDAIYYFAELKFNDKDLRRFDIQIQPDPNVAPYTLTFSQKIYVDL